jgi:dihydropteroate synthase-like protein
MGSPQQTERILVVTGRLAEPALRRVVGSLAEEFGFRAEVAVLGITVAALMHAEWVARKLAAHFDALPETLELEARGPFDRAVLPGWCQGDLDALAGRFGFPFERGPKDLYDLPQFFGRAHRPPPDLSRFDIEILAEINHAPRLSLPELHAAAAAYRESGADVIDLGCVPGARWEAVGEAVRSLVREGYRVSIDSFDQQEVETAVAAGAELVLSCNATNRKWAAKLPAELVAIPDDPRDLDTLAETVEHLQAAGAAFRLDPILEPIGFGFAASLGRYLETRRRWPDCEILMGIGNLTELTEVDSAGVNMLLAGFCQEAGIRSVLTTEVINWCRSAVKEFDLARRLVYHAVRQKVLPKRLEPDLVMLRDPKLYEQGEESLKELAARVTDRNYRVFAERGEIHVFNGGIYLRGTDPFELFAELLRRDAKLDPSHSFYLGYEFAKAVTALTLGKNYEQDRALRWGFLTVPEKSHRTKL